MRLQSKIIALCLFASAASSCTTTLPATDSVRIATAPQEVQGCQFLGDIRGDHNLWGGAAVQIAINDATAQLKNKTAAKGGNVVLVTSSMTSWAGSNMAGKAYRC